MTISRIIAITLPLALFFVAGTAFGQETNPQDYLLVKDLPFVKDVTSVSGYLSAIFKLGIGLAVTAAIFMIVLGGIKYMFSDVPGIKFNAKADITNALWGLVLVLASWLILNTINPQLVEFRFIKTLEDAANSVQAPTTPTGGGSGGGNTSTTTPDNIFDEDPGIGAQMSDASSELSQLLSCMANTVPGNVGRISSISDSMISSGAKTFAQCAAGECQHRQNSHHYGGTSCVGESYAVDFGDEQNATVLFRAAKQCNPNADTLFEGNHAHISLGRSLGCGGGI